MIRIARANTAWIHRFGIFGGAGTFLQVDLDLEGDHSDLRDLKANLRRGGPLPWDPPPGPTLKQILAERVNREPVGHRAEVTIGRRLLVAADIQTLNELRRALEDELVARDEAMEAGR